MAGPTGCPRMADPALTGPPGHGVMLAGGRVRRGLRCPMLTIPLGRRPGRGMAWGSVERGSFIGPLSTRGPKNPAERRAIRVRDPGRMVRGQPMARPTGCPALTVPLGGGAGPVGRRMTTRATVVHGVEQPMV